MPSIGKIASVFIVLCSVGIADGNEDFDLGDLFAGLGGMGGNGGNAKRKGICPAGQFAAPKRFGDVDMPRQFSANGCGPEGMAIDEPFQLWRCCNGHDVCYASCGASFKYCENSFKKCMAKVCKHPINKNNSTECQEQADSFSSMTAIFGKGSHTAGMQGTCDCFESEELAVERYLETMVKMYEAFGVEPNPTFVHETVAKYAPKRLGQLMFKLIKKFGVQFVRRTGTVPLDFKQTPQPPSSSPFHSSEL